MRSGGTIGGVILRTDYKNLITKVPPTICLFLRLELHCSYFDGENDKNAIDKDHP